MITEIYQGIKTMTEPDYSWLQWLKIKLGLRDNEYDTAKPGPERPMTGILTQAIVNRLNPAE